jgi:isopenicillin-N N-acyltransferase-like protein
MTIPFPVHRVDAEDAFERGRQHGEVARDRIAVSLATYRQIFRDFAGVDWDEARRLGEAYATPIERFDPDLLQEILGVAAGSGFEPEELLALNARSEIALTAPVPGGCTSFAAFGRATRDGGTILCQNWDWRPAQRDAFVVLFVERAGRPSITMLTEAGIVGKLGFNSQGLGVCLNAIFTPEVRSDGTPLHVVLRGILESCTLSDAIETVGRAGIASAANFLVAQHGSGAVDIEAAPADYDVLLPERDVLGHTNHLLSPHLSGVRDDGKRKLGDTYPRLARLRRLLEERWGELDAESAEEILRDHAGEPDSICRHEDHVVDPEGKRLQTVFSLVMDLERQTFAVTDGPPCGSVYALHDAALVAG